MQKFTLLHDGSAQGWYATYLAFHVAAQLGAPLQALLVDSNSDKESLKQRAAQIKTGARAAGVAIETHLVADFSVDSLKKSITTIDGLFVPHRLIPDGESAARFLEALSCPLWIASKEPEIREMAVLINDPIKDERLISYTKVLAHRFQQSIKAFIKQSDNNPTPKSETSTLTWVSLPTLSLDDVNSALTHLNAGLLFISVSNADMTGELPCNFVIYPETLDA
jgi:hypothetical protein